jgi:hypothetical protein
MSDSHSDLPIEDMLPLDSLGSTGTDPDQAYDGGWEQAIEEGDGFEDHLLGEKPTTPEL